MIGVGHTRNVFLRAIASPLLGKQPVEQGQTQLPHLQQDVANLSERVRPSRGGMCMVPLWPRHIRLRVNRALTNALAQTVAYCTIAIQFECLRLNWVLFYGVLFLGG
jgi:hypothetical protein